MERVIDVVEDARLCCFREMEVEVFDGWYKGLFLLGSRPLVRI